MASSTPTSLPQDPKELAELFVRLSDLVQEESFNRDKVKDSPAYQKMEEEMKQIKLAQIRLLSACPDSTNNLSDVREALFQLYKERGIESAHGVKVKRSKKKKVDIDMVFATVDKNTDIFLAIADVSQKKLLELAAENPMGKGAALKKCIKVISDDVVGIELTK